MADYPIDRILNILNQASIQQKQPAIYQAIQELIRASRANQLSTNAVVIETNNQGNINTNAQLLTVTNQTATFPSSRQLVNGVGIYLDTNITAQESVNLSIHPFLLLGA